MSIYNICRKLSVKLGHFTRAAIESFMKSLCSHIFAMRICVSQKFDWKQLQITLVVGYMIDRKLTGTLFSVHVYCIFATRNHF